LGRRMPGRECFAGICPHGASAGRIGAAMLSGMAGLPGRVWRPGCWLRAQHAVPSTSLFSLTRHLKLRVALPHDQIQNRCACDRISGLAFRERLSACPHLFESGRKSPIREVTVDNLGERQQYFTEAWRGEGQWQSCWERHWGKGVTAGFAYRNRLRCFLRNLNSRPVA
jgi:hypothetical protein